MGVPKPITVEGISCGRTEYIQGGKDVRAVTGGTRDAAIKVAEAIAKGLCPEGKINSYAIESERSPVMTTVHDSDSRYEQVEKVIDAAAGISGDKCYIVKLNVYCSENIEDYKAQILKPAVSPASPSTSTTSRIPHERDISVPAGTPPPESGRKGKWKGIESL